MRIHLRLMYKTLIFMLVCIGLAFVVNIKLAYASSSRLSPFLPPDSTNTANLHYPFVGDANMFYIGNPNTNALYLKPPKNIQRTIEYDPLTNQYVVKNKMGTLDYRRPNRLTMQEYMTLDEQESVMSYWKERSASASSAAGQDGIIPKIHIGGKAFDRIFGSNTIDIRPQGSAELKFGVINNKREDPALTTRQQNVTNFDFQEKIQLNVMAKIGEKINFKVNYNTEQSSLQFENKVNLRYEGDEDEILQLIEAGDVNLPLTSTLIQGSQSLRGIKSKLKFGKFTVTSVFSEQRSETKSMTVQGGAQKTEFEINIDEYEENKHFFLAQYFRNHYEQALADLPIVSSNINITKVEVWVTNIGAPTTENRNVLAMQDLGEYIPYNNAFQPKINGQMPSNQSNTLRQVVDTNVVRNISTITNYMQGQLGLVSGLDYEKVELARKLKPSEYSLNSKLGFISLNTRLTPNQVMAVAYQYTIVGDDKVYQVGEFSDQGIVAPNTLMVKLLRSTAVNTQSLMWDLMMKNVYSLNAYQVNSMDFMLNVLYTGGEDGVPKGYLPKGNANIKGVPLIEVLKLDRLDQQMNPYPDGVFDFVNNAATNGGTIQASNGRVFFPVLEPFGSYLREKLADEALAEEYCFDSLYSLTKSEAQQYPAKNKFILEGYYASSSSSEITLNALNVPKGSVKVTAGGIPLTENVDYTVDYTLGRVRIINEGILNSGTPINISMESNALFGVQRTKRMMGTHFDYEVNPKLHLGGTLLNLREKSMTQKTNLGDDPINNTIWGFDFAYQSESKWLTRMIDKLPLIETNAPSNFSVNGEFAHFLPGHSRTIGSTGTSYVDDFEGSKATIDLKMYSHWVLASTPQGQTQAGMFPEAAIGTGLNYGMNRAKLNWYTIDPIFYDEGNQRPKNITLTEISRDEVRRVYEKEVFPNKQNDDGIPTVISVFNLSYYPNERGPHNYDVEGVPGISAGIDAQAKLNAPASRWGGVMRAIQSSDFEAVNVEYIEFWMMDPFIDNPNAMGGDLYFNLGDVSEDILRDSRKSFENGLPTTAVIENVDTTVWGLVPALQSLVDAFDNDPASRPYQDVGYDGLSDDNERTFFRQHYLDVIKNKHGASSQAFVEANADPSADNFKYFRGNGYDENDAYQSILERYKHFNNAEGNTPASESTPENYPTQGSSLPNVEDINKDNTLSESERYFQYHVHLSPEDMQVGRGFITDMREGNGNLSKPNGDPVTTKWYQFKIPIRQPDKVVGNINDFKSIRFMRMFMKNFEEPQTLRFATLELVRSDWRKYQYSLLSPGEFIPNDEQSGTIFETAAVNIEENGNRWPVNYVLPPGIEREINVGVTNYQQQNEQSMQIRTCGLLDGDARAIFKTVDFDFRRYKKLKMFVHAEKTADDESLKDNDLYLFLRVGSDFTDNYYECEIPLKLTEWGDNTADAVWPQANNLDLDLSKWTDLKLKRNVADRQNSGLANHQLIYSEKDGNNTLSVKGSPSLSEVRAIMIGIRNPKRSINSDDDGLPKCAEVWVNELRVTDFDNKSAWAATVRAQVDLADFGNLMVSGSKSTPGFGGLESKINDRQKEDIIGFDVATNLHLGKLLPENWGVQAPLHVDYSENRMNPEYNPLDPDINFKDYLDSYQDKRRKDSVEALSQDFTMRKNLNLMNVRKQRKGVGKQHFYDIENFDVSYSYSEIYHRNIDIAYHIQKTYRGGIGYNLALRPKAVEPFKKSKLLRKKYLAILRDFNFYLMPKMFTFRTDINRQYSEKLMRNKSKGDVPMRWTWLKAFDWNRNYTLKYDLTKNLKFEYNATASAYIDEPEGRIDRNNASYMQHYRDSVWQNVRMGGSMNNYNQMVKLNYTLPINKIPLFNWANVRASYQGDYRWTASPRSLQARLGNTIDNSETISLNGNFRLEKLYHKVPYFKKILTAKPNRNKASRNRMAKKDDKVSGKEDMAEPQKGKGQKEDKNKDEDKPQMAKLVLDNTLKFLMMWKDASITYSQGKANTLPGFNLQPGLIGNNWDHMAPGIGYIFGWEHDITRYPAHADWISQDSSLNTLSLNTLNTTLNAKASFEPIRDIKIELTATRTFSETRESYYKYDPMEERFQNYSPMTRGSFSMSYFTLFTAFDNPNKGQLTKAYQQMKDNRIEAAFRLANENPYWDGQVVDSTGFPTGYSAASQEVLYESFVAAYTKRDVKTVKTGDYFPQIPFPNWRITYKGLSKIPALKRWFKNVTLSHSYRSSYNIGSYVSNIQYQDELNYGFSSATNDGGDFINKYDIALLSISEQFVPLLKIDMTWNNSLLTNLEMKRSRNLSLSFVNNQLTEVSSNEYVLGLGYRIKNVKFNIRTMGSKGQSKQVNSDLNLKLDFSIRDNKTVLRRLDQDIDQISAGQRISSLNFTADYMLSQKLNLRFYFDRILTKPHIANQYPNSNTQGGLSLRFTLTQ